MRSIAAAVLCLACFILPARADWPIDKMNQQIEATNVIVSDICSGTTSRPTMSATMSPRNGKRIQASA